MGKILIVSAAIAAGCYGLMVSSAQAGERWPAPVCKEIGRVRGILESSGSAVVRANQLFGLLLLQEAHCGMAVQAELDADRAIMGRQSGSAPPRAPILCDTTPKT